jgi:hypothetical protein
MPEFSVDYFSTNYSYPVYALRSVVCNLQPSVTHVIVVQCEGNYNSDLCDRHLNTAALQQICIVKVVQLTSQSVPICRFRDVTKRKVHVLAL